ncbi:MAG: hypothetical protein WD278_18890 [Pirellulales bacterium]
MGRTRLTLLVLVSSLGLSLSAVASQGAPARPGCQRGRQPVYRLARLDVEPLTPDRLPPHPAETAMSSSLSRLAADARHSTGLELVYSLNDENDGLSGSQNDRRLPVCGARLAADPRHSSGTELAMRLNAENDGLGELVVPKRSAQRAALMAWCAQLQLALREPGAPRRPAASLNAWTGCGAGAGIAVGLDRNANEAAALARVERALSPLRTAVTAVTRQSGLLVSTLGQRLAEAATTLSASSRPAGGGGGLPALEDGLEWAANYNGRPFITVYRYAV